MSTAPSFSRLFLLLALLTASAQAASWWNSDWTQRKSITIDTTATGASTTEDIAAQAVLVRLTDGNFQFAAAKPDGSDLRFVAADDKTLLPYHIEKFDGLLNEALVWVRVPAIKASAKTALWLYYGKRGREGRQGRGRQGHLRRERGARLSLQRARPARQRLHHGRQHTSHGRSA
ncbi:MAG: DUF2341 domain-containing protein [Lacunisphaera sp.]